MPKKKHSILVVEDESFIAANLVQTLSSLGYTAPDPVATGEDAIRAVQANIPDLVLMDIELIGAMNGIEAAEKIRAIGSIPIVYLTAYADDQRLGQARLTEPYGYLVKPVQSRELHATIEMALYRNILDRKLRESEEQYRAVVTQAGDAIAIVDCTTMHFLEVNPAFLRLFGYTVEDLPSLTLYDLVVQEPASFSHEFEKIVTGRRFFLGEQRYRCKDRTELNVEVSASVIERCGKDAVVCMIAHDVTARKQAEHALLLANKKLNLLGSVTRHDVLNKMTVLLGFLEIIKKQLPDPTLLAYLEKAMQAARDISGFIAFTKTYQNLGVHAAGWQKVEPLLFPTHPHEIRVITTGIAGLEIFSDPMLGKVFDNLLDNAIRHGGRVDTISVSAGKTADGLILVWEDNGTGIPADQKEQIFVRGFGRHTGLGLFLAREILDITGITIKETGEPENGARFEMAVPMGMYRFAGR